MTYKEAKQRFYSHLQSLGWKMSSPDLKVPHATEPITGLRIWIKSQSVYLGWDSNLGNARSIHVDLKGPVDQIMASIDYYR